MGSATVISPLELIRTKLQSQKQSYRELTACIRSAVETEGWLSLWRGLGPTLLRDVPFSAMYWYNYERGKSFLAEWYKTGEPTLTITFMAGAASGSVSLTANPKWLISLQAGHDGLCSNKWSKSPASVRLLPLSRHLLMSWKQDGRWSSGSYKPKTVSASLFIHRMVQLLRFVKIITVSHVYCLVIGLKKTAEHWNNPETD